MAFKGAIFDLDGVIVNTVPIHFKAWQKMFGEYGVKFTMDDYKAKVDGIPRTSGAKAILPNLSEEELKKATDKKQGYFLEFLNSQEIPIFLSTIALIREMKENGVKIANISSSKNCRYILESTKLIDLFEVVLTGNDIAPGKGKPDPYVFLTAAEKLKLDPTECVVFEDAVLGVEAAKRGNFRCVGIDRHNKPDNLKKADLVVNDLSEASFDQIKGLFK